MPVHTHRQFGEFVFNMVSQIKAEVRCISLYFVCVCVCYVMGVRQHRLMLDEVFCV